MNAKRILKAYGLWLGGVLSAGLAAWLLYRSRSLSYDLEADYYDGEPADVLPAADDFADEDGFELEVDPVESIRRYAG